MIRSTTRTLGIVALLAVAVVAQCAGGDPGSSVALTVNGLGPDTAGEVEVIAGMPMSIAFTDGGLNTPVTIAFGTGLACGGLIVPWGDDGGTTVSSIDLANGAILVDGIGMTAGALDAFARTDLSFTVPVPSSAQPGAPLLAVQAIHGTGFPNVDNTWAVLTRVASCTTTTLYAGSSLPDDSFQMHSLTVPISYAGSVRNTMYIGTNGQITFGGGDNDFTPTLPEFFAGFQTAPTVTPMPGVAPLWGDFNRSTATGAYRVCEDSGAGTVEVAFQSQTWWNSQLSAGTWSVEFSGTDVVVDLTGALPGASTDVAAITGVSDGDDGNGGQDVANPVLPHTAGGPNESVAFEWGSGGTGGPAGALPLAGTLTFTDAASTAAFNVF